MALNFPNPALQTPLNEFSPDSTPAKSTNGVTYIWTNNEKWVASSVVFNDIYVNVTGDNMTGDLTLGTDKITLNATDGSINAAGDVKIGGTLPDAPNISLNANGVGSFTNVVQSGQNPAGAAGQGTRLTPAGVIIATRDNANEQIFAGYTTGDSVATTSITAAGDARFNGDIQSTSQNGGQLAGFRNQLINGDFRIWQRGDGPFSTAPSLEEYTADRWALGADPDRNGFVYKQNAATNIPAGFGGAIRATANAPALIQKIELNNNLMAPFAVGQTWTVSVWATVDISSTSPFLSFMQADGAPVGSTVAANFVNTGEAASNGYERYSSVITIDADPTAIGTDLASAMLGIRSHRNDFLNVEIKYSGIQLELGPVATPFEHRPIGTELALCQRYYQKLGRLYMYPYSNSSGAATKRRYEVPRTVTMRIGPDETGSASNAVGGTITFGAHDERIFAEVENDNGANATLIYDYAADAEL